nr:hypothetical protein Iba_chr01eCG7120 [Ipomoea batatas]GME14094.1 hypothetical protein Iba_scaffold14936CG0030 [Ipomoea batatas]
MHKTASKWTASAIQAQETAGGSSNCIACLISQRINGLYSTSQRITLCFSSSLLGKPQLVTWQRWRSCKALDILSWWQQREIGGGVYSSVAMDRG